MISADAISTDSLLIKGMQLTADADNDEEKILAHIYVGLYHSRVAAYLQSRAAFQQAFTLLMANPKDSILSGMVYLGLGNAAKNIGDYPEALNNFSKSLRYYPKDTIALARTHAFISQVFQLQDDLPQASVNLQKAIALSGNNKNNTSYLLALHTLANVYGMTNKIDSALMLDEEGIAIARKIKTPELESTFLDNKANCFMYSNRPDSARFYFFKSMAIDSLIGNKKQMADTRINLGILEANENNTAKSKQMLRLGIALATRSNYRIGAMTGWKHLAAAFEKEKDYKQALAAQANYYALKDSILNLKKVTAMEEWKAVYETEQKKEQIAVQAVMLQKRTQGIWFVSISSVLLLAAVYFANRRNKERKEKIYRENLFARDQEAAMKILIAEENERKRIAADLHDGVGQTLTAAWLNLQAIQPGIDLLGEGNARLLQTTTQLVGDSCAEIRQISHNMMPDILFKKGLIPALQEMLNRINDTKLSVSFSADDTGISLDKTTELILYRIIQECANNVVRHARATELYVSLSIEKEEIALMIEDNGIGFQQAILSEGIGLQNIRSRVHYLHGTVEWNNVNADASGTVVAIHIPLLYDPAA